VNFKNAHPTQILLVVTEMNRAEIAQAEGFVIIIKEYALVFLDLLELVVTY
jgi:hypothetical protein